jgi:hypothetical protein
MISISIDYPMISISMVKCISNRPVALKALPKIIRDTYTILFKDIQKAIITADVDYHSM